MSRFAPHLPPKWRQMVEALSQVTIQRLRVELACCVFDDRVVFQDYAPLPFYFERQLDFAGGGLTALGTALLTTTDRTLGRRRQLAEEGIHCNRAVCPVVSDGCATDPEILRSAIPRIREASQSGQIEFVPLAPDADCIGNLRTIFGRDPILLDDVDFSTLFAVLTRSISQYSRSMPGREPLAAELLRVELSNQRPVPRIPYQEG